MDRIFGEISTGFRPAGVLEVLFFVLAILLPVLILTGIQFYRYRKRSRRLMASSRQRFRERIQELRLSGAEIYMLDCLAHFLSRPREEMHRLIGEYQVFDFCARKYLEGTPRQESMLMALRVRLGVHSRHQDGGHIHSTAEIPAGALLEAENGEIQCEVTAIKPWGLVAIARNEGLQTGSRISLSLHRPEGKYAFQTTITRREGNHILLRHRLDVEYSQERGYNRVRISLPVRLDRAHGLSVDFSGSGGCVRIDPDNIDDFIDGGEYPLTIHLDDAHQEGVGVTAKARVLSRNEKGEIHLIFQGIREGDRDRLIRRLHAEERHLSELHSAA